MSIMSDTRELLKSNGIEMCDITVYCRLYRKNRYPVSAFGTLHKDGTITVYKGSLIYDGEENRVLDKDEVFKSMEQATSCVAKTNKVYWMLDWHSLNTTKCLGVYFKNLSPSKPYNEEEALEFWGKIKESTRKALRNKIKLGEEDEGEDIIPEKAKGISKELQEYWRRCIGNGNYISAEEILELQRRMDNEEKPLEPEQKIEDEQPREEGQPKEAKPHICPQYLLSDFRGDVVLDHNNVSGMISKFNRILKYNQNVLFLGPTGTGKSHLAEKLVDLHLGCSGSRKIYRVGRSNNLFINEMFLSVNRGTDLLKFIEISNKNPKHDFFIIVEDIADFDFSSVFFPILTQMEKGKTTEVNLLGDTRVTLGSNLHFICTASENTESRYLLSESVKSRFGIIETECLWGTLALVNYVKERSSKQSAIDHFEQLNSIMSRINSLIMGRTKYLDRNFIGCRCILNKDKFESSQDISDIVSMEIIPQYRRTLETTGKIDELKGLII